MSIYKETIKRFLVGGKAQAQVTRTAQLDLAQFYADCASLGSTVDATLFENSLKALPEVARNEAISYLVPGAYKSGMIYGFNSDTKSVLEFPFSRTSSATYIDKNGLLQLAPANMPRIDYNPVTGECKGYLHEVASTEILADSGFVGGLDATMLFGGAVSFVDTNWSKGSMLAKGIQINRSATETSYAYKKVTLISGQTYTFSCFIRALDGAPLGVNDYGVVTGKTQGTPTKVESFGNGIYRIYYTSVAPVDLGLYVGIYKTSGVSERAIVVSGFNIRVGKDESSYIPTASSQVIRTADTLQSKADIIPYDEASVFSDLNPVGTGTGALYSIHRDVLRSIRYSSNQYSPVAQDNGVAVDATSNGGNNGIGKNLMSFKINGNLKLSANGGAVISKVMQPGSDLGKGIPLYFGKGQAFISQHTKALAIIPRQLTDAEHITATTL